MDEQSLNVVYRWWQSMMLPPAELKNKGLVPAATAHRAQLRRCESADAAMLTDGFRTLWQALPSSATEYEQALESFATIAVLLAHVKLDGAHKLATAAGSKNGTDKPVVSELRFAQLQNAKSSHELLLKARRVIKQLKGDVAVKSLVKDIYQWFKEQTEHYPRKPAERIAVRWAMDYYAAASSNV